MKELVNDFKIDVENLLGEMYQKLDELVCDTMVTMSFYDDDGDANYLKLQEKMIEVIQEQFCKILEEES